MYIIYQQLFFSSNNYINFKLIININNYYHSQSRFFTDQKRWLENRSIHMLSIKILFFKKEKAQKLRCALQIG
ncbi:hypothetical protein APP_13840 [Aeribacillus pallidus]|jgi:hypothetical protein|nr:hypothetical protein APP_13840 [Aeribacillus pallidus]